MSVAASEAWKARRQIAGCPWAREPQEQPGAEVKIFEREREFRALGWGPRELFDLDPDDGRHGHHGLIYSLGSDWQLGQIGRYWVELIGPPDGNGVRSHLHFGRRRLAEMAREYGRAVEAEAAEMRRAR